MASPPSPPTTPQQFNFMIGSQAHPACHHQCLESLYHYQGSLESISCRLDNQVANLAVGSKVPITTGNANILNSATTSSNTVFNSISYENTGIILSFRPHVHANGNVNLEIDQEISAKGVNDCTGQATPCPEFTDRHVKSSIVVPRRPDRPARRPHPGGAGQNARRNSGSRSNSHPWRGLRQRQQPARSIRTELIIFIRPQIIRDGVDASVVAEELRAKMRGDKIGTLHPPGAVTPYPLGLVQ